MSARENIIVFYTFVYRHDQLRSIKILGLEESIPSGLHKPANLLLDIIKVFPPNSFRETIKMGPPNKCIVRRAMFPFPHPMEIHSDPIHLSPPIFFFFHPRRKFASFIKRCQIMNAFYHRVLSLKKKKK